MVTKTVRIDALPESAWGCRDYEAVVCVDVLLAGTTVVTAAAQRRPTFLVATAQEAAARAPRRDAALSACDPGRPCPPGFTDGVGPSFLEERDAPTGSLLLVSDTARLVSQADGAAAIYFASLRNLEATAAHLAARHSRIAVLAAGENGEVRTEDQMVAAWLAGLLAVRGFGFEDRSTLAEVLRWRDADPSLIGWGRSAEELRSAHRQRDLDLVLSSLDDLDVVCMYHEGEVYALHASQAASASAA